MLGIGEEKRRKPFALSTKKHEWMLAARKDPYGKLCKTSMCRQCGIKLTWGDRTYDFDHRNNNSANNSQENCYLVCKICHGKATKPKVVIYEHTFTGDRIYKRTMEKVGYKKGKRVKTTKAKPKSTKPKTSKTKPKKTKTKPKSTAAKRRTST